MKKRIIVGILGVGVALCGVVRAADCPRFRGPAGDGTFPETGLLKQWPVGGPRLAWSVQGLGPGYSSAVVGGGTVYVTGMDDQKQGILFAYGLDGSLKWKAAYGPEMDKTGPAPAGTRGTPTLDGNRIILMTGLGKVVIIDAAKGQVLKTIDLLERFGAKQAQFGFAECVLVDGPRIICSPGGPDASLAALNKDTGETAWQTRGLSQGHGCCSARIVQQAGRRLVLTMTAQAVVAVEPETGKVIWRHAYPHRAGVQPNPPLYADGMVYVSSGMGAGGAMLALSDQDPCSPPVWADKTLDCQMQGTVVVDGLIYGTAQSANKGLVCLDWKTGKVMWNAPEMKMGVVVTADRMLYVYGQDGALSLVKPDPKSFQLAGQFTVSGGTGEHWAHPSIADGRLYIRHGDALMAYEIKAAP